MVEAVRLRAHHNLKTDDSETVDVSALSASCWWKVLAQYLRRRPQFACNDDNRRNESVTRHVLETRSGVTRVGDTRGGN